MRSVTYTIVVGTDNKGNKYIDTNGIVSGTASANDVDADTAFMLKAVGNNYHEHGSINMVVRHYDKHGLPKRLI